MKKYDDKQIRYLMILKNKIVGNHEPCKGIGYINESQPCKCMKVFCYIKELYYSRIPLDYWELNIDTLEIEVTYKKFVKDYIKNIDNALNQGLGMMLLGKRGIGKTSLACEIAKVAIAKRYEVYYNLVQNIVDDKYTDNQLVIERVRDADLIIMDELDKVMMKKESNIPRQIENLLRDLLPNKKSIIICSNWDEEDIEHKFKIISLIKRYIQIIQMEGEDYSEKKQEQWINKLEDKSQNFFKKDIITMAEKFYDNKYIAEVKEYDNIKNII